MERVFVHIHDEFEYTWIGKDNGMIPIYMHEVCGYRSYIITNDIKKDLPDTIRGVEIIKLKRLFPRIGNFCYFIKMLKRFNIFKFLFFNSKNIDVLMLFHISKCSFWYAALFKKINPAGKIYIKADFNENVYKNEIGVLKNKVNNLKTFLKKHREKIEYKRRKQLLPMVNLISFETNKSYNAMDKYAGVNIKGKTIYLPNGYDNYYIEKNIKKLSFEQKKNIFITVGRIGTLEKNSYLLLETLSKLDFKDWKFYFVGPETKEFSKYKKKFFNKNQTLRDKVFFWGEIKDRKKLYSIYNEAKVFILPSKWESFGIVMVEAMAFGNYVITSNTCAAEDITKNGEIGKIIPIDSQVELLSSMQDVVDGKVDLKEKYNNTLEHVKKFEYGRIIKKLNEVL